MRAEILIALALASTAGVNLAAADVAGALSNHGGKAVAASDVRRVSCRGFKEEPTERFCKWQQRIDKRWVRYSSYFAIDSHGWIMVDDPTPAP